MTRGRASPERRPARRPRPGRWWRPSAASCGCLRGGCPAWARMADHSRRSAEGSMSGPSSRANTTSWSCQRLAADRRDHAGLDRRGGHRPHRRAVHAARRARDPDRGRARSRPGIRHRPPRRRPSRHTRRRGCPPNAGKAIQELIAEYEDNQTPEAHLAHDADKIEMLIQAIEYEASVPTPGNGRTTPSPRCGPTPAPNSPARSRHLARNGRQRSTPHTPSFARARVRTNTSGSLSSDLAETRSTVLAGAQTGAHGRMRPLVCPLGRLAIQVPCGGRTAGLFAA